MRRQLGQGLVETAIALPVLLLIMLGVFEVGFAIRNYMVLGNASREAARVAARPQYLDFSKDEPGWGQIYSHTLVAISGQLPEWGDNGTVIFTYIEVKVTPVCADYITCDCEIAATNPITPAVVTTPDTNPNYRVKFPPLSDKESLVDYRALADDIEAENNLINCQLAKKRGVLHDHGVVVAELFYNHHQLFGVPFLTLANPIPMYAHTTMRRETEARRLQ